MPIGAGFVSSRLSFIARAMVVPRRPFALYLKDRNSRVRKAT